MGKRFLLLTLVGAVAGLTGCDWEDFEVGGGDSGRYTQDFHYSYQLKPGGRVSVENFNGTIEIAGWDEDTVDISGTKYANTPEMRDAIKIDVSAGPDAVSVRTIRPSERHGNMGARYFIKVPRRVELERVTSSNGTIRTTGIVGPARLRTTNGALRASDLRGTLDAQTTNGSIDLENVEGSANVRTTNGRVRAQAVRGGFEASTTNGSVTVHVMKPEPGRAVRVGTSNGSIDLTIDGSQNEVRASTSNGSITVRLPGDTNARVMANTSHSTVTSEFDVKAEQSSKNRLEGTIGSGGPTLDLSTSNGGIRILKM